LIFSRLTLEGPINKGKGSYIIAGRRSYGDVLATPFLAGNKDFKGFQLYFYDLTLKANYSLGKKIKFIYRAIWDEMYLVFLRLVLIGEIKP